MCNKWGLNSSYISTFGENNDAHGSRACGGRLTATGESRLERKLVGACTSPPSVQPLARLRRIRGCILHLEQLIHSLARVTPPLCCWFIHSLGRKKNS